MPMRVLTTFESTESPAYMHSLHTRSTAPHCTQIYRGNPILGMVARTQYLNGII